MFQSSDVDVVNSSVKQSGFWKGFVPCPTALFCGVSPEQLLWQQQIYECAYAEALAAVGIQPLKLPVFGPEARN